MAYKVFELFFSVVVHLYAFLARNDKGSAFIKVHGDFLREGDPRPWEALFVVRDKIGTKLLQTAEAHGLLEGSVANKVLNLRQDTQCT